MTTQLTPVELLIMGWTIVIFCFVGAAFGWVIVDMIVEVLKEWEEKQKAKEKEKYESHRRKTL